MGIKSWPTGPKQETSATPESIEELVANLTKGLQKALENINKMTPEQIREATDKSAGGFMRERSLSMPYEVDPKTALKSLLLMVEAVQELKKKGVGIDLEFKRFSEVEPPEIKKFEK